MRTLLGGAAITSALILSGCGSDAEEPAESGSEPSAADSTFDVSGTVEVLSMSNGRPGEPCSPDEESSARPGSTPSGVEIGADVTVTDSSGTVVGLGEVLVGEYLESGYRMSSYCTVPFEVKDVKDGDDFYGVQIGDRPIVRYSRAELEQPVSIIDAED